MCNGSRTNFCYLSNDAICILKPVDRKIILLRVITLPHFPPNPILLKINMHVLVPMMHVRRSQFKKYIIGSCKFIQLAFFLRIHLCARL